MGSDIIVRCHVEAPLRQRATQEGRDLNHVSVNAQSFYIKNFLDTMLANDLCRVSGRL